MLVAFTADLTTTTGWQNINMVADGSGIASSADGFYACLYKQHNTGPVNNCEMRMAFDLLVSKQDDSGQFTVVGQALSYDSLGTVVGYQEGVGFVIGLILGGELRPSPKTILLADNLIAAGSYHFETFFVWAGQTTAHKIIVQCYKDGNFIAGAEGPSASTTWYSAANVILASTSSTNRIRNYAFEPGYIQSATTAGYMNAICVGEREGGQVGTGSPHYKCGIYVPGGNLLKHNGRNVVFLNLRGSGYSYPSHAFNSPSGGWDRSGPTVSSPFSSLTFEFLKMQVPVFFPIGFSQDIETAQPGFGGNFWADDEGMAEITYWTNYINQLFPNAYLIVSGYSMGGLTLGRLVSDDSLPSGMTLKSVGFFRSLIDLYNVGWDTSMPFSIQQKRAWFTESYQMFGSGFATMNDLSQNNTPNSAFTSSMAHQMWDPHNAMATAVSQSAIWSSQPIYIDHSSVDSSIDINKQGDLFISKLVAQNIPYTEHRTTESHTDVISAASARAFAAISFPGDVDGDGMVSQEDLDISMFYFGQTVAPYTDGDANGDGQVNQNDVDMILFNFGS